MADEALAATEADQEALNTPSEDEQDTQQEAPADDPIENLARELGWRPKEEFGGPEEKWRPAADFIREGREVQRSLNRELKTVREEVSRISRTSAQLMADKIAERDSYWQNIHRKAVEDGDVETAERAVTERAKLKTAAEPDSGPPPETRAFIEKHKSWFNVDPLATMRTQEICAQLAKHGVPIPQQLEQAERAIRKEFPELFPAPAKTPAAVQTATSRNASTTSRKKGYADMPAESQKMAQDYLKKHGIPLEKFAESYFAQDERKVG